MIPLNPKFELHTPVYEDEDIALSLSILSLMEILKDDEKNVILLKYYDDLTFKEISEVLEIPLVQ